ncbi:MAG: DUF2971 domain-containing protein [Chthoniobacteraceae bacterium]
MAKLILKNRCARWSSPLRFNDPFDCYFSVEPKFNLRTAAKEYSRRFFDLVYATNPPPFDSANSFSMDMSAFRALARIVPREILEAKIGNLAALAEGLWKEPVSAARDLWRVHMARHRIFCVCAELRNLLLWAHYADSHKGVAFELDGTAEEGIPLSCAEPVVYSRTPPGMHTRREWIDASLGLIPLADGMDVWKRQVLTKGRAWSYEKEWRIVGHQREGEDAGFEDSPFDPKIVTKIFLGCRMNSGNRAAILRLASKAFEHVEIYEAKQSPTSFKLSFQRLI